LAIGPHEKFAVNEPSSYLVFPTRYSDFKRHDLPHYIGYLRLAEEMDPGESSTADS
jgi:hypothetical protein